MNDTTSTSAGLLVFASLVLLSLSMACDSGAERPEEGGVQSTSQVEDSNQMMQPAVSEPAQEQPEVSYPEVELLPQDTPSKGEQLSDAELDRLVNDAMKTREGREALAPLFGRDFLKEQANTTASRSSRPANATASRATRQATTGQVQANEREPAMTSRREVIQRPTLTYVDQSGRPIFVGPTGQTLDAQGNAVNAVPLNGAALPGQFGSTPNTGTRALPDQLVPQIPPRRNLPAQTPRTSNVGFGVGTAPSF